MCVHHAYVYIIMYIHTYNDLTLTVINEISNILSQLTNLLFYRVSMMCISVHML